jgi:ATP/maltotriose-dependent transcriptional regulator MalT
LIGSPEHGFLEEALEHALAVKNTAEAVAIFARQRVDLMNETRWQQLEQQLNRFPPAVVETQPELFMAQVWLLYYRGRWDELPAALEHLGGMLDRAELRPEALEPLQGEAETIIALLGFISGDCDRAITSARFAIDHTPQQVWMVRMLAQVVMAAALQANGQPSQAYQSLYQGFEAEATESDLLPATRLALICFIHWIAADLDAVMREANRVLPSAKQQAHNRCWGSGAIISGRFCISKIGWLMQRLNLPASMPNPISITENTIPIVPSV